MKTIGFAGTAKNTGKTTTVLSALKELHACSRKIALTSIGYDGEQLDTVTGLPKPRYTLMPGDLVATALDCVAAGTAKLKIVQTTQCKTILGAVVIAEILEEGTVLVAGPNRQKDLADLIERFRTLDIDLLLVDGALNRLTPMILCDGLVLATGASFNSGIDEVTKHISALVSFFNLPVEPEGLSHPTHCIFIYQDGSSRSLPAANLIDPSVLDSTAAKGMILRKMIIPGVAHPELLGRLLEREHFDHRSRLPVSLVMASPLRMITSGHIEQWGKLLANSAVQFTVLRSIPLICLTVNPFYPRRSKHGNAYEPAFADRNELLQSVRKAVRAIPVFDLEVEEQPNWSELLGLREEQKCQKILT